MITLDPLVAEAGANEVIVIADGSVNVTVTVEVQEEASVTV